VRRRRGRVGGREGLGGSQLFEMEQVVSWNNVEYFALKDKNLQRD
jgi:hypothetical protein